MTYDQWKTDPDWGRQDPPPCSTCGSTWEDGGKEWDGFGDRVEPFGRCPECGWSCEPCPDIEDAIERGPFPCAGCGAPLYDGDQCVNAACPSTDGTGRDFWLHYDNTAGKWCVENEPPKVTRPGAEVIHTREVGR